MTLLQINSTNTGEASVSRALADAVVSRLTAANPALRVVKRDLANRPLAHFELHPSDSDEARANESVLEEFLAADIVVVGAPMYNFTIASQLKAWIDRLLVAGRTFQYGDVGPEGLAGEKRVIVVISRGGHYGADTPMAAAEHGESYLRAVFGFIGITPEFVVAEGLSAGPDHRIAGLKQADDAVIALAA